MGDSKMMGSLADKLLWFVNTTLIHDTNYQIATKMLEHYAQLKQMNLSEMAELCYASKSAITRFCHFIGFENFQEFQVALKHKFDIESDYTKEFRKMMLENPDQAEEQYCEDICTNIKSILNVNNQKQLSEIVKSLSESRRIVFLSHHFLWDIGNYFQSKMMMMGRYVEQFMDYDIQLKNIKTMTEQDMVIVCSIGGSYPSRYADIWDSMEASGCKQLIITQNNGSAYWNGADYILKCGEFNKNDVGKYAALTIVDLLVMKYYNDIYRGEDAKKKEKRGNRF